MFAFATNGCEKFNICECLSIVHTLWLVKRGENIRQVYNWIYFSLHPWEYPFIHPKIPIKRGTTEAAKHLLTIIWQKHLQDNWIYSSPGCHLIHVAKPQDSWCRHLPQDPSIHPKNMKPSNYRMTHLWGLNPTSKTKTWFIKKNVARSNAPLDNMVPTKQDRSKTPFLYLCLSLSAGPFIYQKK